MKIVLSRKGFDASSGGVASPILPDGRLLSLPIPSPTSPITYDQVGLDDGSMGPLIEKLTKGRVRGRDGAHLDPDLRECACRRRPGWRPLFGQDGTAQGHLRNAGLGPGDLFLFFGWFRQVERTTGGYRFLRGAPDLHVVFGWLQVGDIVVVEDRRAAIPAWADYHPHFHRDSGDNNTVYVAREELLLPGMPPGPAGGGTFERYNDGLRLTAPGLSRSRWRLPKWFFPTNGRPPLSYHGKADRWALSDDHASLRAAPRGQEFVLDVKHYPEALAWACGLITGTTEVSG